MISHTDMIGITLSELAFVVLFSLAAALVPSQFEQENLTASLQGEMESLKRQNTELKRQVVTMQSELRSKAKPTCVEAGIAKGWLFTTTIRGRNAYELNGRIMSLEEILSANRQALLVAEKEECLHRIKLFYGLGVAGIDYDYALRRIEEPFATKKMGPKR